MTLDGPCISSAQRLRHDVAINIPRARAPVNANCDGIIMVLLPSILLVSYIVAASGQLQGTKNAFGHQVRNKESYTSSWAVEITDGGEKMANIVAGRYGFKNLGKLEVGLCLKRSYWNFFVRLAVKEIFFTLN